MRLALAVSVAAILLIVPGSAADNIWTNAAGTSAWNLVDTNWTGPVFWNNNPAAVDVAIFGPTGAGTVTVASGINARALGFSANGYVLSGGGITFQNTGAGSFGAGQLSVDSGVIARVDSNLLSAVTFTKMGAGEIVLGGANNFTGATVNYYGQNVHFLVGGTNANAGTVRLASGAAISPGAAIGVRFGRLELGAFNLSIDRVVVGGSFVSAPINDCLLYTSPSPRDS